MRRASRALAWLLAGAAALAALHAGAAAVVIVGAPWAGLTTNTSWQVDATVRNMEPSPSAEIRWELWAAESVEHAAEGFGFVVGSGAHAPLQPGGVFVAFHSGTHEPLASGTYQLVFVVKERSPGANDTGYVVRDAKLAGTHTVLSGSPNYTGLWWDPGESGWGLNLSQQGSIIFATLFTYSASGQPMWLVASRVERRNDMTYSGKLYRTAGPAFDAPAWGSVAVAEVGVMRLRFQGTSGFGIVTYELDGATVSKEIFRQVFAAPVPVCGETLASRASLGNYQDLWWNPAESGWGVYLTHQGDKVFATLFTYSAGGAPEWFVASNLVRLAGGGFAGELYRMTGPRFDARPWGPVSAATVGSMNVSFENGERGTLVYNVNGATVAKPIQRQVFSAPQARCQ